MQGAECREMTFRCRICGECCSHLGLVHTIREECGGHEYLLLNRYTGEITRVSVDPDKVHLLDDRSIFRREPEACPFLRDDPGNDRVCCIVHGSRPDMCREFQCWRLLILDRRGRRAGRVMQERHLCADDPVLQDLWERCIAGIHEPDEGSWDEHVTRLLSGAGYQVMK